MAPPAVDGSANPADPDDVTAAEAHAALAEERARAARERAAELRRLASGPPSHPQPATPATPQRSSSRWRPAAAGLAAAASCGLLGLGTAMTWNHHVEQVKRSEVSAVAAAAREGVTRLMSLNFVNAEEDVQSVLDDATGQFKKDFEGQQYMLVKNLVDSKSVTKIDITAVAVQSATADSGEALVAVTARAANRTNPQAGIKRFRVAVSLAKDQGRLKLSQVAFI